MHIRLHNVFDLFPYLLLTFVHRFSFQEMSKNTQLSNDILKIIKEKRIKRNVMTETDIISKDNDMIIIINLWK